MFATSSVPVHGSRKSTRKAFFFDVVAEASCSLRYPEAQHSSKVWHAWFLKTRTTTSQYQDHYV
ncbi:hypothetical protein B9Q11_02100 [Candidatus Marsarchaeota G2 archaeon ECH_B_SAG-F08]|uniref:Uncharacterized protein n=1 Tax=Candidatus Marsarchaeota G2 archaeon ECH_B_SAG-F08 TaxID=1978165 RepID=A0A2R6BIS9_9ARCH|nr:MAG: hypothetical protein B9Q11_02100 [Candidatus Marsarchaeota G2 archaeon ECH_B_SAG-F08]